MKIKTKLIDLLNETQPFGYELKMVKACLSAKMEQKGEPVVLSIIDRYLNMDESDAGKLSRNFESALSEVTGLQLSQPIIA